MTSMLATHRIKLTLLLVAANTDLLLKSRSAGYVTNLLFMGLACLFSASSWAVLRNLLRYQTPLRGTAGLSRVPCRSISC